MRAPDSNDREVQRLREALAVAEATLDTMISDVAAADAEPASDDTATGLSQERVDALSEEIGRLRRQVQDLKDPT